MQSLSWLSKLLLLFFAITTISLAEAQNTYPTSGNVGINTTSPHFQLDVSGAAALGGTSNNFDPGNAYASNLANLVGTGKLLVGWNRSAGWGECDLITNTLSGLNGGFIFWNQNSSGTISPLVYMSASTGNVLIGNLYQVNTAYKLDVSGQVRANEVTVNTTGADFVFDPGYRLPKLTELDQYIRLHRHLPDVAPARQMQEQGIKLGDNETRLLQKVEELTLYIIDQDKKISTMQSQIDELKALIKK